MALSNILNEPAKEITESVVGIAAMVPFVGVIWWLASTGPDDMPFIQRFFIATAVVVAVILVLLISLVVTHAIGEAICNKIRERNKRLRAQREWRDRFANVQRGCT